MPDARALPPALVSSLDLQWPAWLPTPEQIAARERRLLSTYFLVRIDGLGERGKCRRCGRKHEYFTLMCVERPWCGIDGGLFGYYQTLGAQPREQLSPTQQARLKVLDVAFGPGASTRPDLATS